MLGAIDIIDVKQFNLAIKRLHILCESRLHSGTRSIFVKRYYIHSSNRNIQMYVIMQTFFFSSFLLGSFFTFYFTEIVFQIGKISKINTLKWVQKRSRMQMRRCSIQKNFRGSYPITPLNSCAHTFILV